MGLGREDGRAGEDGLGRREWAGEERMGYGGEDGRGRRGWDRHGRMGWGVEGLLGRTPPSWFCFIFQLSPMVRPKPPTDGLKSHNNRLRATQSRPLHARSAGEIFIVPFFSLI